MMTIVNFYFLFQHMQKGKYAKVKLLMLNIMLKSKYR